MPSRTCAPPSRTGALASTPTASEEPADGRLACDVVGEGERPIGFLSLIADVLERHAPRLCALDIIIGAAGAIGRGLGTEMMTWGIRRCFADSVEAVPVDPLASDARATRFCRRPGFRDLERRRFDTARDCLILTGAEWTARG